MHPPLDRPHPDCQEAIEKLRHCHSTNSKWKFWACNELKFQLDICFRDEKQRMLKQMNKNFEKDRKEEEEQFAACRPATAPGGQSGSDGGSSMTYQDFLANDPTYQKELEQAKRQKTAGSSWFG